MVCDNCFCNGLFTIVECVPTVAILAMALSAMGFIFNSTGLEDMVDGLDNFGIDTEDFKHYILGASISIVITNSIVLVFAFFSTGCCKEKCFHHAKTNCGACFEWMMGPIAQIVFFVLTLGTTIISFLCLMLCEVSYVLALMTDASCETDVDIDYAGTTVTVSGEEIIGSIVQNADLPDMLDAGNSTINGTALCNANDDFKDGSGAGWLGFTLLMFGQILFLVKISYTYVAIRDEMSKEDTPSSGAASYGTDSPGHSLDPSAGAATQLVGSDSPAV